MFPNQVLEGARLLRPMQRYQGNAPKLRGSANRVEPMVEEQMMSPVFLATPQKLTPWWP